MELTFAQQSTAFLWSIPLGICLGILYGVFKVFRTAFSPGKIALIFLDVLFMLIATFALFLFSLAYLLGFVRIYIFIGAFLGFIAYRSTLGLLFSKFYCPIIKFFRKILSTICIKFKKITKSLLKIAHNILYNKDEKLRLFSIKSKKSTDNKKVMVNNEAKRFKGKRGSESRKSRKSGFEGS